jgi:ankyrin repeat protein
LCAELCAVHFEKWCFLSATPCFFLPTSSGTIQRSVAIRSGSIVKFTPIIYALFLSLWAWPSALCAQDKRPQIKSTLHFPAGKDRVVIPWKWAAGAPITNAVTLNGKSVGWFVIDTGASASGINAKLAQRLSLPLIISTHVNGTPATSHALAEYNVGGIRITQHLIFAHSFQGLNESGKLNFAGILGGDVFGKMPFSIDYKKQTLTFYQRHAFQLPEESREADIELDFVPRDGFQQVNPNMGQPLIPGMVEDTHAFFSLDTGAAITTLLPKFTAKHKRFVSDKLSRISILKVGFKRKRFKSNYTHLALMGKRLPRPQASIAMVGQTAKERMPYKMDVVVGNDILRDYQWWFDYKNKKAWALWNPYPSIQQRLAAGLDPNFVDAKGQSLLSYAVMKNDVAGVNALIRSGAKLKIKPGHVIDATLYGHLEILEALLGAPNSPGPNVQSDSKRTPLHAAAWYNETQILDLLIRSGAKVDAVGHKQVTALHFAANSNHLACIERLLAAGADPNRHEAVLSATPLGMSVEHGNINAVKALLQAGANGQVLDPKKSKTTAYHVAAVYGHAKIIRLIHASKASKKPSVNALDDKAQTPLVVAILKNKPEAVASLLKIGANPTASYRGPITVLDLAKVSKNPKIRNLIEAAVQKKSAP